MRAPTRSAGRSSWSRADWGVWGCRGAGEQIRKPYCSRSCPGRSWLGGIEGRVPEEAPAERTLAVDLHDLVDLDLDRSLRAREPGEVRAIPENARPPGELKRGPRVEVHEEKTHPRMGRDVAEGLEHVVPGIVGEAQRPLVHDLHEARPTAAMRGIRAGALVSARDEERIGALDGEPLRRAEGHASPAAP